MCSPRTGPPHRIFRRPNLLIVDRQEGGRDVVGIDRLGEIVHRTELRRIHRGGDIAVAGRRRRITAVRRACSWLHLDQIRPHGLAWRSHETWQRGRSVPGTGGGTYRIDHLVTTVTLSQNGRLVRNIGLRQTLRPPRPCVAGVACVAQELSRPRPQHSSVYPRVEPSQIEWRREAALGKPW
jgi:hypothetical protein